MVYYFQLEVKYLTKLTAGHVLLSSCTTTAGDSLCSQRDDMTTTECHHTSVSCSSKVCYLFSLILLNVVYVLCVLYEKHILYVIAKISFQYYNKTEIALRLV